MSKLSQLLVVALAIIVIAGCEGTEEVLPGLVKVRALHASPDAPRANFTVTGPVGELTAPAIDYKQGTGSVNVRFGKVVVEIETIRPGGNQLEFELKNFALTEETNYEVMLIGKIADSTLDTLIISNPQSAVSPGSIRMQFVHASPDIGDILVYITAPDAALDGAPSLGPLGYKSSVAPVENPAADYQIRLALASDPLTAIFDTGGLAFAPGGDLMITVVNNTGAGAAPISLVVQQEGVTASTLLDVDTPADLRFVHAAPDAPLLDLIIDDATTPSFSAMSFTGFSDYLDPALVPGTHTIKVVDTPAPGTIVAIDASPVFQIGVAHSIFATGLFANLPLAGILLQDNNRRIATEAKFRVVNASTVAGTVDVYVVAPGTAVDSETPINARVAFQTPSLYLPLAAGDYEVTLTAAADPEQVLVDATPITVVTGGIYTAVAVDSVGGIAPVQWIMMDDFATP